MLCLIIMTSVPMASKVFAVSIKVSPLAILLPPAEIFAAVAPRYLEANSKETLVLVLFSKNRVIILFPERIFDFLMSCSKTSFFNFTASSNIAVISSLDVSFKPNKLSIIVIPLFIILDLRGILIRCILHKGTNPLFHLCLFFYILNAAELSRFSIITQLSPSTSSTCRTTRSRPELGTLTPT